MQMMFMFLLHGMPILYMSIWFSSWFTYYLHYHSENVLNALNCGSNWFEGGELWHSMYISRSLCDSSSRLVNSSRQYQEIVLQWYNNNVATLHTHTTGSPVYLTKRDLPSSNIVNLTSNGSPPFNIQSTRPSITMLST